MANKIKGIGVCTRTRGSSVFARPLPRGMTSIKSMPLNVPLQANDIFLYALFARITLNNGDTVEFETKYDPASNTIELIISNEGLAQLDQMVGIKKGPNFQTFINWLISSDTLTAGGGGGSGGGTDSTVTTFDATPTTITAIAIPDNSSVLVNATISARRTDAVGHGGFIRRALVGRDNGGPAIFTGPVDYTLTRRSNANVAYDVTFALSGSALLIDVHGKNGHTIDWKCNTIMNTVS